MRTIWIAIIGGLILAGCARGGVLADWTFETTQPRTAGAFAPEIGNGSAIGHHADPSAVYSTPLGNGSLDSFSSNTWTAGDYYQFSTSTVGFTGILFRFDQTGSDNGPRDFKIQYSADGAAFTDLTSTDYKVTNDSWPVFGTPRRASAKGDFAGPASLDDQAMVYFRILDDSSTSITGFFVEGVGTDRVDNVTISASAAVPEPSALAPVLVLAFAVGRRGSNWRYSVCSRAKRDA
jgi:hypothetical protein